MVEPNFLNKNLTPLAVIIAALIMAGSVVFTGIHLKGGKLAGLGETLDRGTQPAAVANPEPEAAAPAPQVDTATLEKFAKCLKDKGLKFYGASWCGWCKRQKELFGQAQASLPYIECTDPATNEMTSQCQQAGISSFPTWIMPDGTKNPGFKQFDELAKLSGCKL